MNKKIINKLFITIFILTWSLIVSNSASAQCVTDPDCDDSNPCTDDACVASVCEYTNNAASCDDGNACTTSDTCSAGVCVGGAPPNCNDGNVCTDDSCNPASGCVNANNTAVCDDGLYCTQVDVCQNGQCIGSDDPCVENKDYCDGEEYCQEDIGDYLCTSTGNPCGALTCDDTDDTCNGSDVTLIIADSFGYEGTIDIELENTSLVSEVHFDMCDVNKRAWLQIETGSCSTTTRSSDFNCVISNLGSGCVGVDLTTTVDGLIDLGNGVISQLSYTLDINAPYGEFAHLTFQNSDVKDDTPAPLSVTPKGGKVGVVGCVGDLDCDDNNVCTDDVCVDNICQYTNNTDACDDGLFCNGEEFCVEGICEEGSDPCTQDETCDEEDNLCMPTPQILLEPESWFQSRWIPVVMPLKIKGSNTHFESFSSEVTFNPVNSVWALPPNVKDEETISMVIFLMPLSLTKPLDGPVEVTVTTGAEVVSGFLDVTLLPFILDE